jgi:Protein of unknown function (DUF2935).
MQNNIDAAKTPTANELDNRFWLEVMGDYARLIITGLPETQADFLNRAQQFKTLFDNLLERAMGTFTIEQLKLFNQEAYQATQNIRTFILEIIKRIITQESDIIANLYPEILNHMINDTELYLTNLAAYLGDISARVNSTQVSLDWLFNIYTTCKYIGDNLSIAFFRERSKAEIFQNQFLNLYLKAFLLNGFRRTGLSEFPSLIQANDEIQEIMMGYATFIVDLIRLKTQKKIIGPLSTLFLDNTYRQLCYYMTQLSEASTIKPPLCDPSSPRREDIRSPL